MEQGLKICPLTNSYRIIFYYKEKGNTIVGGGDTTKASFSVEKSSVYRYYEVKYRFYQEFQRYQ